MHSYNKELFKRNTKGNCCDNQKISKSNGFHVCSNCGAVFSRIFDNSPRRIYNWEDIKKKKSYERVISPIGPRTVIKGSRDAYGNLITAKYKTKFYRLSKIHRSLINSFERNLWRALPHLQTFKKKLSLPERVAKDALRIYIELVEKKLTMGRSINNLLCASIYCAVKIHGVHRDLAEISESTQIPKKKIMKNYKLIVLKILPLLNLKVQQFNSLDYIDKFSEDLELSMKCRNKATNLVKKAKKNGFASCGKDPKGIAAAALYLSSKAINDPRTQKDISQLANITEVTLRLRMKEILKYYNNLEK